MVTKEYSQIVSRYATLVRDKASDPIDRSVVDRAAALCKRFTPQRKGGDAELTLAYDHAVELIEKHGVYIPADITKHVTDSFVMRYAREEVDALLCNACIVVAMQEEENGREFHADNVERILMTAMGELHDGRAKIETRSRVMQSRSMN